MLHLSSKHGLYTAGIGALLVAVPLTVFFLQNEQNTRSRASLDTAQNSLLANPSFETAAGTGTSLFAPWLLDIKASSAAVISQDTAIKVSGVGAARIEITQADGFPNIQLLQNIAVTSGDMYEISFYARASEPKTAYVLIQDAEAPNTVYKEQSVNLTTTWLKYTIGFVPTVTDPNARFAIHLGESAGTIWLDDVVVVSDSLTAPTVTPTVTPTPVQEATPTPTVIPTETPTPTLVPTLVPTATVTPTPIPPTLTATPTPTPQPTLTPVPTAIPTPSSTRLGFTFLFRGIGQTGNKTPLHPTRVFAIELLNSQNQLVQTTQVTINYDTASGLFKGELDLGLTFPTGYYTIRVKGPQYLKTLLPGIQRITQGKLNQLPQTVPDLGDITNDNKLNMLDYDVLIGCYSDFLPPANCTAENKVLADLNDDGKVNQVDYNLFLRELFIRSGA